MQLGVCVIFSESKYKTAGWMSCSHIFVYPYCISYMHIVGLHPKTKLHSVHNATDSISLAVLMALPVRSDSYASRSI